MCDVETRDAQYVLGIYVTDNCMLLLADTDMILIFLFYKEVHNEDKN